MANGQHAGTRRVAPHGKRIVGGWVVLSVVADLLFGFLAGPHLPPGRMTDMAGGQQFDIKVLFLCAIPVVVGVIGYLIYAVIVWREGRPASFEPPSVTTPRQSTRIQVGWIATTSVLTRGLFVFGTVELILPAGAGGGEGPNPIWTPASKAVLPIQVIAQQWKFTYRYPTYGGFETDRLVIPENTPIAFHVTSLDVVHDFWAYQLGVKADANPQSDNVAYATADQLGSFVVRCDELCGIWHGAMYNYGRVETKAGFNAWALKTERATAANTKLLPPFAWFYSPSANGAGGTYYPSNVAYSKVQVYGAATVSPQQAARTRAG
jgi:cytochrome c oxidase subunit 2